MYKKVAKVENTKDFNLKNKKVQFLDQQDDSDDNEETGDEEVEDEEEGEENSNIDSEESEEMGEEEDFEDDEDDEEDEENDDDGEEDEENEEAPAKPSRDDSFRDAIRQELNQMSFEEIQKLQNKLGLKKFKEVMSQESKQTPESEKEAPKLFTRLNKNRPQEISSKKRVSIHRNVFQAKKREPIDPRFSQAIGEYKPEVFRKRYGFINDMRKSEKEVQTSRIKLSFSALF